MNERSLIDVKNISYSYLLDTPMVVQALRDVSFSVRRDQTVGIVGPTGSGKSTLLYHLNGLLRPQEGEVWVDGVSLSDKKTDPMEVRQKVGLLFQNPEDQLFERFAGDDVAFGPRNFNLSREEVRERVRNALELVGLPFEFKDRLTADLSLGEKRRVALAGIFAMNPEVLVLDEPTASLDPAGRRELLMVLKKWRSRTGRALVVVSHNMEDIVELADYVYLISEGQAVFDGKTDELFLNRRLLERNSLVAPVTVQVLYELEARGFPLPEDIVARTLMSSEELVRQIARVFGE
jgi:energy-coupling factor transport system ATP-binding protein